MTQNIAVQLANVTKEYVIHHEKPTLVEKFIKRQNEHFIALNRVSVTIHRGERVGVIGPNGSGKTTLLKLITGITSPTSGTIKNFGKVVSLIDLEAGFHPDLTGYQNIFLNGMLLGMSKKTILKKMESIIHFADIRQFIDAPMFTYSNGMSLRVGVSVALHANPDILILDEGLNVGDVAFQNRIRNEIYSKKFQNITLVMASHNPYMIEEICNRIIYLENGSIRKDQYVKPTLKRYDLPSFMTV